jgi:putative glutamine amidotransferase
MGTLCAYVKAVEAGGGMAVLVPPADPSSAPQVLRRLDGVVLSGGTDIDPGRYGETPRHASVQAPDRERDEFEIALVRHARALGVPVLGICRGHQLMNVALGGSLYQDIVADGLSSRWHPRRPGRRGDHLSHSIDIAPGTVLAKAAGTGTVDVNSMHHQAVRDVGEGLTVTAISPDGVIEGVESEDGRLVAVQCHPEELLTAPWALSLFTRIAHG